MHSPRACCSSSVAAHPRPPATGPIAHPSLGGSHYPSSSMRQTSSFCRCSGDRSYLLENCSERSWQAPIGRWEQDTKSIDGDAWASGRQGLDVPLDFQTTLRRRHGG